MAVVVNVKVAHIRPAYRNLKEWMADEENVYIGRRGIVFVDEVRYPPRDAVWANPYKIGRDGDRDEVLQKYRVHIEKKIREDPETYNLDALRGKRLGCWCAPERCHGDVLLELLAEK